MQNITTIDGLKNAIQLLEAEQATQGQLLTEQFYLTYESFRPLNILRNALKDITSSPNLIDNILGTAVGLTTGYLSKKIFIGTSGNLFRKLIGSILQFGVTNAVVKHPDAVKSLSQSILQHFLHRKGTNSDIP